MSTPIPHFRNFKGHGYDPGQNSWFEFSIVDFNFQIQHLNFTAEFKNLYSCFRIHIIGKRFYTCRLAFELNFFIWPCSRYIFNSLCQITQSNHVIFNSTNKFLHTATFCQFWYLDQYSTFDGDENFAFDTYLAHFASHSVIFQTQPRIFWTQLLNFCLRLSAEKKKNLAKNNMHIYLGRTSLVITEYREYFMESAGVRYVRTSCWRIRNRTSA